MLAGDQRQCHERRMGHHAGAGHRCCEPHRNTQDRTEHQGTGSIHRQHCRCSPTNLLIRIALKATIILTFPKCTPVMLVQG